MIPSVFVHIPDFPFTPSGKVDRGALPAPEGVRRESGETLVVARTPIEQTLVQIWAVVLGIERAGVHDNFFELGGHSLLATQVTSRARQAFQIELPLRLLFESPTVAELALRVTQLQVEKEDPEEMARLLKELENL